MAEVPAYEKHTPTTDALDTLGTIISAKEKRDAIHLAVFPVQAACNMKAGDHVDLEDGLAVPAGVNEGVGIVDPFVSVPVMEGDWFWLVIYPRQIHSLRHVWEHPAFPASGETDEKPAPTTAQQKEAEEWIRNWMEGKDLPSYEKVIAAASGEEAPYDVTEWGYGYAWKNDGDYITFYGDDAHCDIPPEFWEKLSILKQTHFDPAKNPDYFSCSC